MTELTNKNEDMSLFDMISAIKRKAKLLICITLVAAILGGCLGAYIGSIDVYGTTLKFQLSQADSSSVALTYLNSDGFSESLLLDKNGLPESADENSADYKAALEAKDAAKKAAEAEKEAKVQLKLLPTQVELAEKILEKKQTTENNAIALYHTISSSLSGKATLSEEEAKLLADAKEAADLAVSERELAEDEYNTLAQKKLNAEQTLADARKNAKEKKATADKAMGKFLDPWRKDPEVRSLIKSVQNSIKYEYADSAKTFLNVEVEIKKDLALAEAILDKLVVLIPEVVESAVSPDATPANAADAVLISTFNDAEELGEKSLVVSIIKYALIAAAAAFVLTCVCIVIVINEPKEKAEKKKHTNA